MFKRIALSIFFSLFTGILAFLWLSTTGISDISTRLCIARALLLRGDLYSFCMQTSNGLPAADYPLTTIIFLIPFSKFSDVIGASLFWAFSNGLLMYGILTNGNKRHLLIFLSGAYWCTFMWQQFSVLISAIMFLPSLLPLAFIKPQIGIPVILTNITRNRFIACLVFIGITFIFMPGWLSSWYARSKNYDGVIPILFLPISIFLFPLFLKWKDRSSVFILLMSCMPQRTIMDTLPLFTLPKSNLSMIIVCLLSWIPAFVFIPNLAAPFPRLGMPIILLFIYFPITIIQFIPDFIKYLKSKSVKQLWWWNRFYNPL